MNNGKGREVQITARNEFTAKMEYIKEIGTVHNLCSRNTVFFSQIIIELLFVIMQIVYIASVKASAIKNKIYNNGNVDFQLIVKENSTFETSGTFSKYKENNVSIEVTIADAYSQIN